MGLPSTSSNLMVTWLPASAQCPKVVIAPLPKSCVYRSRSIGTEAYAERRPGGPGRVGGIGHFGTVDAGIFRGGEGGGRDQRQYNRGAGY